MDEQTGWFLLTPQKLCMWGGGIVNNFTEPVNVPRGISWSQIVSPWFKIIIVWGGSGHIQLFLYSNLPKEAVPYEICEPMSGNRWNLVSCTCD